MYMPSQQHRNDDSTFSFPACFSIASYPTFPIITGMTACAFLRTYTHNTHTLKSFSAATKQRLKYNYQSVP